MSVPYPVTPEEIKHAEAVLLGSLLFSPEQGTLVHTVLQPEDFSEDRELEQIGGEAYFLILKQQAESTTISIEDQAYLLKQSSFHRMLMHVGEALHTHTMYYDSDDLLQLLGKLELENDDRTRLEEASTHLRSAKLWIDDTANLSTTQLHDKAHHIVKYCGVELLIVDYVHLMLSSINDKRHENRVQEIGEISRSLKALARELDIPVLALAHLSRAFESRPAKQFQLSDLRDGSLENDADLVLFLSPSDLAIVGSTPTPKLVTIHIAKHRNGPRSDLDVCFQPSSTRFHDLPTLAQPSTDNKPLSSVSIPTNHSSRQFPNLMDLLEQSLQRHMRQVSPKDVSETSSQKSELSDEYSNDEPVRNNVSKPETT